MNNTSIKKAFRRILQLEEIALLLALFVLCTLMTILTPTFVSKTNILNILRQVSMNAITGFGMAMLMLLGAIDLSVGSAQALVAIVAVSILNATRSPFLAIACGLLFGALLGLIIGVLTVKLRLISFIVTLGMQTILRGAAMVVTDAQSIRIQVPGYGNIGTGYFLGIPIPVILMIVLFFVVHYVLTKSSFGRQLFAIGGNREAAKLAGLKVDKVRLIVFVISGVLTALSAMILSGRLDSAQPNAGIGFETKVISAVVLGGVSMSGGRGKLTGVMIGMLLLGVLSNGLTLLQVSSFWQDICTGIITILAVYIDASRRASTARKLNQSAITAR